MNDSVKNNGYVKEDEKGEEAVMLDKENDLSVSDFIGVEGQSQVSVDQGENWSGEVR